MSKNFFIAVATAAFAVLMGYALFRALRDGKALYRFRSVSRAASPAEFWFSIWPLILGTPILAAISLGHFVQWIADASN